MGGSKRGACGRDTPPPQETLVVRGAEGAEEIFWPKLTCAEDAGEKFAQSLKGQGWVGGGVGPRGGGWVVSAPPPPGGEMLSC